MTAKKQRTGTERLVPRDSRDPIFKDNDGPDADRAILARHRRWLALQDDATRARFCDARTRPA